MHSIIKNLPKAELHVHLVGTMQPEQLMFFAERNKIKAPFQSIEQARKAYQSCNDLASFLKVYALATQALQTEQDFYDLLYAYLERSAQQNVIHIEIFFEVQIFIPRGISFATIMQGISRARADAHRSFGISCLFIFCFLRDRTEEEALELLEASLAYTDMIVGIGLASNEQHNPPLKFATLYTRAKEYGYKCCIHAGEEVGPEYIWQALELPIDRIDHGVTCMQDPQLVAHLVKIKMPLTVCPLSNVKLNIVPSLAEHPIAQMLKAGLLVSINSDDPAFFGSLNENYYALEKTPNIDEQMLIACARNAFISAFVPEAQKQKYLNTLQKYLDNLRI